MRENTNMEQTGLAPLILPYAYKGGNSCSNCAAHHPAPQLSGNLQIDPEIHLPSRNFPVDIAYYYNASSKANGPFGYGRTISPNMLLAPALDGSVVTLTRGNGSLVSYTYNTAAARYFPSTPGLFGALQQVGSNWTETTPDGFMAHYALISASHGIQLASIVSPVNESHLYIYNTNGLLDHILDPYMRAVTFSYISNPVSPLPTGAPPQLLASIQDWANRLTTFQYDTMTDSSKPLLQSIMGPTGCQTVCSYTYNNGYKDWLLSGITDPNGFLTTYAYDSSGRVIQQGSAGAGTTSYQYLPITGSSNTSLVVVTDALGNVTTMTVDATTFALLSIADAMGGTTNFTYGGPVTVSLYGGGSVTLYNQTVLETSREDIYGNITTTTYDSNGNLTSVTNPNGQTTTTSYDNNCNPTVTQYPDGGIVTRTWDSPSTGYSPLDRRLQASTDPVGNTTSYTYINGQIRTVQNALGYVTTYGYDNYGNQASIQDPLGNITSYGYDLAGNVTSVTDPLGHITSTTYDGQNRPLTIMDSLGNVTSIGYDSNGNRTAQVDPLGNATYAQYNVFDKPVWTKDANGNVTTYLYNALGWNTATVDALGHATTIGYDKVGRVLSQMDALGNISTNVYDLAGKMLASVDALGNRTSSVYDAGRQVIARVDALGYRTSYSYDPRGRQIAMRDALNRVSTNVYDLAGKPIARIDALGHRNTTIYDAANRSVAFIDPLIRVTASLYDRADRQIGSVDALGYVSTTVYDQASRMIANVDALGYRTSYSYDSADRQISVIDARGNISTSIYDKASRQIATQNALGYFTTTVYDPVNRIIASIDPLNRITTTLYDAVNRTVASIDALGYRTTYNYDNASRPISVQDANGHLTTNVYDAVGRSIASVSALGYRTTTIYDAVGQMVAIRDALGYLSTSVYDGAGQMIASIDPLKYVTTMLYDLAGRNIAVLDALGNRTTTIYDAASQVITNQDERGYLTTFAYDPRGLQIALMDANGHANSMNYDRRRNLISQQNPLGVFTTYLYDTVGNTALRVDGNNRVTTYAYDALNQETSRRYFDSTRITTTFDAAGQQITLQDQWSVTGYAYDQVGQQVGITGPQSGDMFTYSYDGVGNRTKTQFLRANAFLLPFTYSYDADNNLVGITNPYNERTTIVYDALGREQNKTSANGMTVSHIYDAAGRETLLANYNVTGAALAVFTNTYDSVGNRLAVQELVGSNNSVVTFLYDASYQLVNEHRTDGTPANSYNTTYAYDGLGNRLSKVDSGAITTYAYNAANALFLLTPPAGQPTTSFYDGAGNLTQENTGGTLATYTWDGENRMTGVTDNATSPVTQEVHSYYASGLRRSKQVSMYDTDTQYYVWDGENVLLGSTSRLESTFLYTNDPLTWGQLVSSSRVFAGGSNFYGFDSQSSTRILVSQNGIITDNYNYKAFGEAFGTSGTTYNPYLYIGAYGYYQDNTSRYYVRARHINVALGRWISRDPIGFSGGDWNLYRYVNNNSINNVDIMGLQEAMPSSPVLPTLPPIPLQYPLRLFSSATSACLTPFLAAGLLFLPAVPCGPIPNKNSSCAGSGRGSYPRFNSIYTSPAASWSPDGASLLRNPILDVTLLRDHTVSKVRKAVKLHYHGQDIKFDEKPAASTAPPCAGIGWHVVMQKYSTRTIYVGKKKKPEQHRYDLGKSGTIVCCPTCDDLEGVAMVSYKCAFLIKSTFFWNGSGPLP